MTWIAPDVERRPRADLAAGERALLEEFLYRHRTYLLRKCAGLTAEQLRTASVEPSKLTLLGLVRHMTGVERFWFREKYAGQRPGDPYPADEGVDGEIDLVADADAAADHATLLAEMDLADAAVAGRDLDEPVDDPEAPTGLVNLRFVYLHVIEEYAQHNGHADLIRERIDGQTGF
ncbi:DinB family protein [Streptomyces sp. B6B3]|uniref:DinB family protein n=1 Tax=Streptomyces sp. B6B3 TaxID=3153570 RepID=UPI00325C3614